MKHTRESFYEKYYLLVYAFLWDNFRKELDQAHARETVEELFQQTWVKIYQAFERFEEKSEAHIKNSLRVITQNVFIDYVKRQKRELERTVSAEELMEDMVSPDTIDTALFTLDKREYLKEAMKILDDEERYLIREYFYSGRRGRETAALLNMNHNTLRTKVNRICGKLRLEMQRLMKEGGDLDDGER